MAIDITIYWGGPASAGAPSTYKIEYSFDALNWTQLVAAQAATSPYASAASTLSADAAYGATSISLVSGADFSATGRGYVGKAHIAWTGKSSNTLTGVTWYSGAGLYATGAAVTQAHESYTHTAVDGYAYTVFYRITHQMAGEVSPYGYVVYYVPPAPASPDHCVLLAVVGTDIGGLVRRAGVTVTCALNDDTGFDPFGAQTDANTQPGANAQVTGVDGAVAFQLWRTSALAVASGGSKPKYVVVLGANESGSEQSYEIASVPDTRAWLLLSEAVG